MASFRAEFIADASRKWATNAQRFATREEAEAHAAHLARRWTLVREWRAVESEDSPNCTWVDGASRQLS